MTGPDRDRDGKVIRVPLLAFDRFIDQGMSCIVKLVIDGAPTVQFSLTPQQCREIAENLIVCAQVIELERPTAPQ